MGFPLVTFDETNVGTDGLFTEAGFSYVVELVISVSVGLRLGFPGLAEGPAFEGTGVAAGLVKAAGCPKASGGFLLG